MSELDDLKKRVRSLEEGTVRDAQRQLARALEEGEYLDKEDFNDLWKTAKDADDAEEKEKFALVTKEIKQLELAVGKWEANGFAAAANGANFGFNGLGVGWDLFKIEPKPLLDLTDKLRLNDGVDWIRGRLRTIPGPIGQLFQDDPSNETGLLGLSRRIDQVETKVGDAATAADLNAVKRETQRAHTEIGKINTRLATARDAARSAVTGQPTRAGAASDTAQINQSAQAVRNLQSQVTALLGALD